MIANALHRLILYVAPRRAVDRLRARAAYEMLATYDAAKRDRGTRDWKTHHGSADDATLPDLAIMTDRARQMVRDNAYARSIVLSFGRNVVGTGITPQASARFHNGRPRAGFNEAMTEAWHRWANDPALCDVEGHQTFSQFQRQAVEAMVETGEAFVLWSQADNGEDEIPIRVQMIEGEQLDLVKTKHDGRDVVAGVEIDATGRPVAYHIHPLGVSRWGGGRTYATESQRIPADRVQHLYVKTRAGQTRGVTWFAPVLNRLRDLAEYDRAMLWAARMEACIGLLVTRDPTGMGGQLGLSGPPGQQQNDMDGNRNINLQPGMVGELNPGESVTPFMPSRPGGTYDPYVQAQLRAVAAGVDLSYAQVARDFSDGNFSSQRQAKLEDERGWEALQLYVTDAMCRPIWREAVRAAILGRILPTTVAPAVPDPALYEAEWMPQGWDWVDPVKEVNALAKAIDYRFVTREDIANSRGKSIRRIFAKLGEERAMADEAGITLPEDRAATPPAGNDGDSADIENNGDDDDRDD